MFIIVSVSLSCLIDLLELEDDARFLTQISPVEGVKLVNSIPLITCTDQQNKHHTDKTYLTILNEPKFSGFRK